MSGSSSPAHEYEFEQQPSLFGAGSHDLIRMARVDLWWLGTCSCGWKSAVKPDRWRVEQQHREHVRRERTPWHEREH